MNKFLTSVPVFLEGFKEAEENQRYTTAKLKVYYIGETPDHRLFTQEFSDKVIKTLPLTPVVAFYSEEDEDFKGHNKTQFMYGVVPDGAEIEFVEDEDSGKTFAVTDVVLYTERTDNIGEVAKKIIGKQHSLELDPRTLKYKINRDSAGRFMNVEFLDGQFIGLSVLGDNEKPAFTGSEFFTVQDNDVSNVVETCKEKFDKFLDVWKNNGGSIEVFDIENFFTELQGKFTNFAKITMQEFQEKIYQALYDMGTYGWLIENTDEYAIISVYLEEESRCAYLKYSIKVDGDSFSLENPVEVKARFLTQEQIDVLDANANASLVTTTETPVEPTTSTDDNANAKDKDDKEEKPADGEPAPTEDNDEDDEKNKNKGAVGNATVTESNEQTNIQEKEEQVAATAASASATALSDSERAELEEFRRQAKLAMINEYRGELTEDTINEYIAKCDELSKDELEAKLAIEYRKFAKTHKQENTNQITAFSLIATDGGNNYNPNDSASVIKRYAK